MRTIVRKSLLPQSCQKKYKLTKDDTNYIVKMIVIMIIMENI